MAMDDNGAARRDTIAAAIATELDRQAGGGAARVDIDALAEAVDKALDVPVSSDEGKRPDQLNATNDD